MTTIQRDAPYENRRMLKEPEAASYSGMGRTAFRKWAKEIGARRTFGSSVMYDKQVIDRVFDEMDSKEATE